MAKRYTPARRKKAPSSLPLEARLLHYKKLDRKDTDGKVFLCTVVLIVIVLFSRLLSLWPPATPKVSREANDVFAASLVGDLNFGGPLEEVIKKRGWAYLFASAKPYFEASDHTSGNFNQPILLRPTPEYEPSPSREPRHTSEGAASALAAAKFTTLTLANPNIMDYSVGGLMETTERLEHAGLTPVGAGIQQIKARTASYATHGALKIATLAASDVGTAYDLASPRSAGAARARLDSLLPEVQKARKQADVVLVHLHWGVRLDNKENQRQRTIGRALIDAGADVVIGHYPGALQPIEVYKDGVILYSLGNFTTDQPWTKSKETVIARYFVQADGTRRLELIPMQIHEGAPRSLQGFTHILQRRRMMALLQRGHSAQGSLQEKDGRFVLLLPKRSPS
ncbi:hypothetical protein ABB02_01863 [Clostridiaceae bacterium JG1575]|nr:hypothetical protein ABB02_01863 [Clostridiaceae bacterium JG1575]